MVIYESQWTRLFYSPSTIKVIIYIEIVCALNNNFYNLDISKFQKHKLLICFIDTGYLIT